MPTHADRLPYRAWLESRWPSRSRALALYAAGGGCMLLVFDLGLTRALPAQPGLAVVVAARLAWLPIPVVGLYLSRRGARWLPAAVVALSLAWAWGNAATYLVLGLGGSSMQALANVLFALGAGMFLPLTRRGRVGFFAVMWAGCTAVDLAWPQARSLEARLWTAAGVLGAVVSLGFVFGRFAQAQRRGLVLRRRLERTVAALRASRSRADEAVAGVTRLAAEVAHDVNNPLAAVKANLHVLRAAPRADELPGERAEIAADTLEAVDRIAAIVAVLRRKGVGPDRDH